MDRFLSFNFEISDTDSATIPAASGAALYGRSLFTTIALRHGRLFLWPKHRRRLSVHAKALGITLAESLLDSIGVEIERLVSANDRADGRVRVTLFDRAAELWQDEQRSGIDVLIMSAPTRVVSAPLRLTVSPFRIHTSSPVAGLKCGNYLEPLAAFNEARGRGFDECLRFNERGEIVSASLANVFWTRGGDVFTPAIETGCLAGTTREFLIEEARVHEIAASVSELETADEIFLTSAGIGVATAILNDRRTSSVVVAEQFKKLLELNH